jgi:site-specific recombinase XerD
MLEAIYTSRWKLEQVRRCWLYDPIDAYLAHRASRGYRPKTLANAAYLLLRFANFVQDHRTRKIRDLPRWIDPFLADYKKRSSYPSLRSVIDQFIAFLRQQGQIVGSDRRGPAPRFFKHIFAYEQFLKDRRGLMDATLAAIRWPCVRFLTFVYDSGVCKLRSLHREAIHDFIRAQGEHYGRASMAHICSALRGFLSFLYTSRRLPTDFSAVVVAPTIYKHERCPRFLTPAEVGSVLSAVDRHSACGKRDYAALLLLATYGLRGIEVARLRLDDIEWRAEQLHIRSRKGGNHSVYPLTSATAEALVAYLKHARPKSTHREVFLTHHAPFRPVQTVTLRHVVKKHLRRAGIKTKGAGAHTFRYSCAQRLFENDFSIKVIGDYLGHRHLGTTQRYMKIDLKHLREVAINDGEGLL